MTCGFMWNSIRGAPFVGNRGGHPVYFVEGYGNQIGVETFIMAGLCN